MSDPRARVELCTEHFYLFWWWYFPHYHRYEIPEYKVPVMGQARAPRLLDIEPRDHGKSVVWSCGYPLWVTLTNPYGRPVEHLDGGGFRYLPGDEEIICQLSYGGSLPRKWMRRHKRELTTNRRLIADFGEQSTEGLPGGVWTKDEIVLRNGGHIYSKGSFAQIRGDHPTEVVVDDLEDRKEAKNPDIRAKVREYFYADAYGALEPDSRLKVVGTIVHPSSLLKELYDKEIEPPVGLKGQSRYEEKWQKFRFEAELPDGSPLAPEIWPHDALAWRKATVPRSVWMSEYMNRPETSASPVFPEAWFKKEDNGFEYDAKFKEEVLPELRRISFIDPNVGEDERDDWTAIVTVGYALARVPEIYVLEVKQFRSSFRQRVAAAIETWRKWHGRIGFEAIAFQSYLAEEFGEQCQEKHYHPDYFTTHYRDRPIKGEPLPKKLDKVSRAERVQEFFELNQVRFNYRDPAQLCLIDELTMFPDGDTDDQVDAVVGCLTEIKRELAEYRQEHKSTVTVDYDDDTGQPTYDFDEDEE